MVYQSFQMLFDMLLFTKEGGGIFEINKAYSGARGYHRRYTAYITQPFIT